MSIKRMDEKGHERQANKRGINILFIVSSSPHLTWMLITKY
uniref:Uncharacterized protein n=1 Tax=Arundo donax TaxID=35708 RepID=A0A0A9BDS5_ARUDO